MFMQDWMDNPEQLEEEFPSLGGAPQASVSGAWASGSVKGKITGILCVPFLSPHAPEHLSAFYGVLFIQAPKRYITCRRRQT